MALIDNLVSYWPLSEASGSAIDAHGTNDLAETSGTIGASSGIITGARDFEAGDTEHFVVPDSAALSTGDIDFTLQAWVNLESLVNGTIVSKWNINNNRREFILFYNETDHATLQRFSFGLSSDGTAANSSFIEATTFGAVATATWYHVVVRHDSVNNSRSITVNNVKTSAAYSAGVFDSTADFALGTFFNNTNQVYLFDGLICEVGFWKRHLSDAEVTELYNGGAGLAYPFSVASGNRRRRMLLCGRAAA